MYRLLILFGWMIVYPFSNVAVAGTAVEYTCEGEEQKFGGLVGFGESSYPGTSIEYFYCPAPQKVLGLSTFYDVVEQYSLQQQIEGITNDQQKIPPIVWWYDAKLSTVGEVRKFLNEHAVIILDPTQTNIPTLQAAQELFQSFTPVKRTIEENYFYEKNRITDRAAYAKEWTDLNTFYWYVHTHFAEQTNQIKVLEHPLFLEWLATTSLEPEIRAVMQYQNAYTLKQVQRMLEPDVFFDIWRRQYEASRDKTEQTTYQHAQCQQPIIALRYFVRQKTPFPLCKKGGILKERYLGLQWD